MNKIITTYTTLLICLLFGFTTQAQTLKSAMQPAVKNGGFKMEGYILWCPSVIKVGNTYHMFASR